MSGLFKIVPLIDRDTPADVSPLVIRLSRDKPPEHHVNAISAVVASTFGVNSTGLCFRDDDATLHVQDFATDFSGAEVGGHERYTRHERTDSGAHNVTLTLRLDKVAPAVAPVAAARTSLTASTTTTRKDGGSTNSGNPGVLAIVSGPCVQQSLMFTSWRRLQQLDQDLHDCDQETRTRSVCSGSGHWQVPHQVRKELILGYRVQWLRVGSIGSNRHAQIRKCQHENSQVRRPGGRHRSVRCLRSETIAFDSRYLVGVNNGVARKANKALVERKKAATAYWTVRFGKYRDSGEAPHYELLELAGGVHGLICIHVIS